MRLLADECFDERPAVRLWSAGLDVARVAAQSGLDDLAVARRAEREDRVLPTQDTDFGRTAPPRPAANGGVDPACRNRRPGGLVTRLVQLIAQAGDDLSGAITVLDDRGARSRPII